MKVATFWGLIEKARSAASETKDHANTLADLLAERKVEDIIAFEEHLVGYKSALYRHDLWLACYLLCGGYASDDGFKDFRSYLISMGKEVVESALRDPDSLADLLAGHLHGDEVSCYEEFVYAAGWAYNRKTGSWFEEDGIDIRPPRKGFIMWELTRPDGEALTFDDAATHLPKLHARFMEGMQRSLEEARTLYSSDDPSERRQALWDFSHFAHHSADALAMLRTAARDRNRDVKKQAKEYLDRYTREAERE